MVDRRVGPGLRTGPGSVSVTRTGKRTFRGRNETGVELLVGPVGEPGHFSPGELLKLALAGCTGLSADQALRRRLGDDVEVTVWAHGRSGDDNRYQAVDEEVVVDVSGLDDDELARLVTVVARSIQVGCTVARSVEDCVELTMTVADVPATP